MEDLHVTLIQAALDWENVEHNLNRLQRAVDGIENHTDLIVLPEMFLTGFTMNSAEMAQKMDGPGVSWMKKVAKTHNAAIAGSLIIEDTSEYFNRLIVAFPDGSLNHYDKRHLFRMAEENDFFTAGNDKVIVNVKGWKINLQVCYDLRFPVWSRNRFVVEGDTATPAYDAMLYVANWPEARISAWNTLLSARAIENQCYVIGVNRVGEDGNQINYNGSSQVIDPKGQIIASAEDNTEENVNATLSYSSLEDFRKKFPVGLDAD